MIMSVNVYINFIHVLFNSAPCNITRLNTSVLKRFYFRVEKYFVPYFKTMTTIDVINFIKCHFLVSLVYGKIRLRR